MYVRVYAGVGVWCVSVRVWVGGCAVSLCGYEVSVTVWGVDV